MLGWLWELYSLAKATWREGNPTVDLHFHRLGVPRTGPAATPGRPGGPIHNVRAVVLCWSSVVR